jgi:hypothetical protein
MKSKAIVALFLGILSFAVPMLAEEGGDQYPNGAESWGAGMLPPPGTFAILNYFQVYSADLKNGSGDTVSVGGKTASAFAVADAIRPVYMSKLRFLGGDVGWYAIIPTVYQRATLGTQNDKTGIGDITVQPFFLAYHFPKKNLHLATVVDFDLPTGYYNAKDPRTSIGTGYVGIEPAVAITYLNKAGWEASTKQHYHFTKKNETTNYASGQNYHFDYLVGKHIGQWGVGGYGYFLKQMTDDKQNGTVVPATAGMYSEGRKGQVLAIGPNVSYTTSRGFQFMAGYSRETLVRNRFGGDKLTVKVVIPTRLGLFPKAK